MENEITSLSKSDFYNLMKDFIGYGNPKAKIWIIGQEENFGRGGYDFDFKSQSIVLPKESFDYYSLKIIDLKTYHKSSNILEEFVNNSNKKRYFEYGIYLLYKSFISSNTETKDILNNVFVTNINFFPISRKGSYKVLTDNFGVSKIQFEEDTSERRNQIRKMIFEAGVKDVIFLGSTEGYYKEFLLFADLKDNYENECWDKIKITSNGVNYIFSYHPSDRQNRFENRIKDISIL